MLETKILLNSVISDAKDGARFCGMDLKDMFLQTPMKDPEYMKISFTYFPEDVRQRYNLYDIVHNEYIYIKNKKGMYGLKQAAILAYEFLTQTLLKTGYHPIKTTLGLSKHETQCTIFCLCVDNFGVKYYNMDDHNHLRNTLETEYVCKIDMTGSNFLGFTLYWHYKEGYVDLSIPGYVPAALKRLQYILTVYPQYSPHKHIPINYSIKKGDRPTATEIDTSPLLE